MSDTPKQNDWTKPAAMAIPKEGFFEDVEQGRYGPIFPKTPACYGFTIIAKIKPGTEEAIREYGKKIEKAMAGLPDCLAVLKLHYLRWVLFDIGKDTYFMYQGIFDTDFDKYTEDAVALFSKYRHQHGLRESRRVPRGLEDERAGVHQVRPRAPVPELPGIRRVSVRQRRRDQEGAQAQGGVLRRCSTRCSDQPGGCDMLEFDDIQHILLDPCARARRAIRVPVVSQPCGRAEPGSPASWTRCSRPQQARASVDEDKRWVTVALHLERPAGARRGRGFAGHVSRRVQAGHGGPRGDPRRHRRESSRPLGGRSGQPGPARHRHPLRPRCARSASAAQAEHRELVAQCEGVEVLSSLDLEATPPFDYAHDHFGYRDRLSQPVIEGSGEEPTPGSGAPLKAGEFILGYPDEDGAAANQPAAGDPLAATAATWPTAGWRSTSGAFRDFLRQHGETPEEQELIAAKLMGRWRSGAPLVLAPDKDDPALGADPQRNNDFNYKEMDPHGYAVPLGSHIRRMNPRDTAANMNRRRMIRRGATYGPHLPEGAPEDGVERGIAAFVICASLIRQFEFAQNVWVNDKNFHELGNERDPIIGNQDGTLEFKIPKRPIRKKIKGLPAFTTVRGGAYFFLPGLKALRYLATLSDEPTRTALKTRKGHGNGAHEPDRTDLQPEPRAAAIHAGQATFQHLLDVELSLGSQPRPDRAGQSLLDHDRGSPGRLAELRDARVGQDELPAGDRRHAGAVPPLHPRLPADRRRDDRASGRRLPAHRPGGIQAADRRDGSSRTPTR